MKVLLDRQYFQKLKKWFLQEGIEYPWGENPDSYSVWISEIMLQQTQVKAVIPYFIHWMSQYPDLAALASASEEQLTRSWEGLGYYSRVRNIHRCARELVALGKNQLPENLNELMKLPGIGPYTAAAISSIAYGKAEPVMDANVRRICQRLGVHGEWNKELENQWIHALGSLLRQCGEPGLYNCAMMQLGQLVCRKSSPLCILCPFESICEANKQNLSDQIPAVTRKKIKQWTSQALIFYKENSVYLEFRDKGIGKGLWSLPCIPEGDTLPRGWEMMESLKERPHYYTSNKEMLKPLVLVPRQSEVEDPAPGRFKKTSWQPMDRISEPAMPAVYRRIIEEFRSKLAQG